MNYQSALRNTKEERRSHVHCRGSLQSLILQDTVHCLFVSDIIHFHTRSSEGPYGRIQLLIAWIRVPYTELLLTTFQYCFHYPLFRFNTPLRKVKLSSSLGEGLDSHLLSWAS
jgi:hypothetical protein